MGTVVKWTMCETCRWWSVLMVIKHENPKKEDVIKTKIKWEKWSVLMVIRNKNSKKEDVIKRKIKGQ
jgi:hypothetical protein